MDHQGRILAGKTTRSRGRPQRRSIDDIKEEVGDRHGEAYVLKQMEKG